MPGRWIAALAAAAALSTVVAGAVRAVVTTPISCGDSITKSIVVANDLPCTGTALVINANGVTLNLNGHTLTGDGDDIGNGVEAQNFSNLTIENGTVTGFHYGILVFGTASKIKVI